GRQRERERVAAEQVELRKRRRHQPLERPASPLAQHRHGRHDEHRNERKEAEQRRADVLEDLRLPAEDLLQQRLEQAGHAHDEDDRARVAPQLRQDPERGRGRDARAQATSLRKTSSSLSAPVRARSSAGLPVASNVPSRRSSNESQRSASSMTWLDTSSVAPASASSWKRSQRSRRSTGSRPTVGSSRTSSSGVPSSAVASETRARCPLDSFDTTRDSKPRRSTRAIASSTAAAPAPRMRAK